MPNAPEDLMGTIQNISDDTLTLTGAKAVSFINWSMPEKIQIKQPLIILK